MWRYGRNLPDAPRGLSTGFGELDRALPQNGWVGDGLNELIGNEQGVGEFSLILPALAAVGAERRTIVLANPPFLPYAPALADAGIALAHLIVVRNAGPEELFWTAEQALRSKACGAVVAWSNETARPLPDLLLRRLQVAAAAGHAAGFLYRPRRAREHASPAALRIAYAATADGALDLTVVKARGMAGTPRIRVQPWRHPWAARIAVSRHETPSITASTTASSRPAARPSPLPRHPSRSYDSFDEANHALDRSPSSRTLAAGEHARTAAAHPGRDH